MGTDARSAEAPTAMSVRSHIHLLRHGQHKAAIDEVGGAIRSYAVGDVDVLTRWNQSAPSPWQEGAVLAPWPNRLADGVFDFNGVRYHLPITEPARGNALHGLVLDQQWTATASRPNSVTLVVQVPSGPNYPFTVELTLTYALDDAGLSARFVAVNRGETAAPFAIGFHPYVAAGDAGAVDDCTLQLRALAGFTFDDQRRLPTGIEPVAGTVDDFTAAQPLRHRQIDTTFVAEPHQANGVIQVQVRRSDGREVTVWGDQSAFPFWHIYTADDLPPARARRGVAVEPMSAPPNAFRTYPHLCRLAPGDRLEGSWGVRLTG